MSSRSADATDLIVARNIRIQRIARHMSQAELARRLGVAFQQVQKYEKGVNRVGSGRLACIAEAFDLPITAFFQGTRISPQRKQENSALPLIADRAPVRLVQAFARIDDRSVRRAIVRLVESCAPKSTRD